MAWTRKLPSGKWQGSYRDAGTRVHSATFLRKQDAKDWADENESLIRRGDWIDPERARRPFEEWAESYMASVLHQDPATKDRDASLLKNHLLPHFGEVPLSAIETSDVRIWVASLQLAPASVALAYQPLSRILRQAEEDRLILRSPCSRSISLPKGRKTRRADRWLSLHELKVLSEAIEPRFQATVLVMGIMGLRFGEAAGLTRPYLNMLKGTLEVAHSLQERSGQLKLKDTKTLASARKLKMPDFLIPVLAEHLRRYSNHPDYVFTGRDGAPLRKTWARRHFAPAAEAAGLSPLRPHHLRHTSVALLIGRGAHAKDVQEWCGHSSFSVTMDVYGHLFPERQEQLATRLNEAWLEALEGNQ